MTKATHQKLLNGSWNNSSGDDGASSNSGGIKWFRFEAVEEGDTITEGVEIGRCVSATFHLGTVTTIPTSNPGVYEIQAGNPDGTWNDIGTQISIAVTTGFMDSVTISNPPDLLRLKQSGSAPDDAEYNILIEAHSSNV